MLKTVGIENTFFKIPNKINSFEESNKFFNTANKLLKLLKVCFLIN